MPKGIPKNGINKGWIKKGNVPSEEMRRKISEGQKGRISPMKGKKHTLESKHKTSLSMKGKIRSVETRKKMSESKKGEKSYNWKGGTETINKVIRKSLEYRLWRTAVFERDDYTCIFCGIKGGELNADHIKPFALFPELRFAIDNGRTLCVDCHRATDTWGNKPIYN